VREQPRKSELLKTAEYSNTLSGRNEELIQLSFKKAKSKDGLFISSSSKKEKRLSKVTKGNARGALNVSKKEKKEEAKDFALTDRHQERPSPNVQGIKQVLVDIADSLNESDVFSLEEESSLRNIVQQKSTRDSFKMKVSSRPVSNSWKRLSLH